MDHKENELEVTEKQSSHEGGKEEETSYREYIKDKIKEKAIKIREELKSIEHKAVDFLNKIFKVVQKNRNIREYLKSMKNYYLNYFFNYFGYRYEPIIENPNFFHFISQAWLVNAFEQIKGSSVKEEENYSTIMKKLLDVDVDKKQLISSLELITETIYISDPAIKLTELNLGKNFLKHIKKVLSDSKNELDFKESINKNEFGVIVMEILKKTVNLTINDIDSVDNDNQNLILLDTFNELLAKNENFSLEDFTSKVEERRDNENNSAKDVTITNACEAFYYFGQSSLSTLIIDLEMFNQQYSSFISKIKIILSKKSYTLNELLKKFSTNMGSLYIHVRDNIKFQRLNEFYNSVMMKLSNFKENSSEIVSSHYKNYKDWILSLNISNLPFYSTLAYEKINTYTQISRVFLYEKVFLPTIAITVATTSSTYSFILRNVENAKNASLKIYSNIKDGKIGDSLAHFKEDYIDKIIRIYVDEDQNLIVIEVSRKVIFNFTPESLKFLIDILNNIRINLSSNAQKLLDKSKETSLVLKDNIMERYRRFFNNTTCDNIKKKTE
jgi:hypothetical protein